MPSKSAPLVLRDLPSYLKDIESIRGIAFKESVASGRQSLAQFRRSIEKDLDRDLPPTKAACFSRALSRLGLLPAGLDLRKAIFDLLVTQVAAYYDPDTKTFYVVHADLPEALLRPTVIHELTHALQDQRFGIAKRIGALREQDDDDAQNAFRFLAEGEASYVMTLSTLRDQGIDLETKGQAIDEAIEKTATLGRGEMIAQLETMKAWLGPEAASSIEAVLAYPDYLFRIFFEPYLVGQRAIRRVHSEGGWAAVNDLWERPPASTEMFLHPEKLAKGAREQPVKVEVPDLSSKLGAGYAPGCENTLGELETEILLEEILKETEASPDTREDRTAPRPAILPSDSGGKAEVESVKDQPPDMDRSQSRVERARVAATGWGGDRYRSFERKGGATVVVWRTVWDTENDALEFAKAMRSASLARLAAPPLRPKRSISNSRIPTISGEWITSSKTSVDPAAPGFLVARRGQEVTFVVGAIQEQARNILVTLYPLREPVPGPAPRVPPPESAPQRR